MFCECGTYLPNELVCPICSQSATRKSMIYEKYHNIAKQKYKNDDRGAIISEICPKCNYHQMYYKAAQLRSADEGQTIFYECGRCSYKFSTHS